MTAPETPPVDRLSVHALRVAHATLVERPLVPERRSFVWAANIWLDGRWRSGWARRYWRPSPDGRGWRLPADLATGDILEFGADQRRRLLPTRWAHRRRWYGYLTAITTGWLLVHGPYDNPGAALDAGARWQANRSASALELPAPAAGPHCYLDRPR
jgi:hypothetical protein